MAQRRGAPIWRRHQEGVVQVRRRSPRQAYTDSDTHGCFNVEHVSRTQVTTHKQENTRDNAIHSGAI